jgi:uncharacterized membrane protein YozB (DUF420 family)
MEDVCIFIVMYVPSVGIVRSRTKATEFYYYVCSVLCILFHGVLCTICVNMYCTAVTGCQPSCI